MTNFERIKSFDAQGMAAFLSQLVECGDETPWILALDRKCKNCKPVEVEGVEFAPCEMNNVCCPFANIDDIELAKYWLMSEEAE